MLKRIEDTVGLEAVPEFNISSTKMIEFIEDYKAELYYDYETKIAWSKEDWEKKAYDEQREKDLNVLDNMVGLIKTGPSDIAVDDADPELLQHFARIILCRCMSL